MESSVDLKITSPETSIGMRHLFAPSRLHLPFLNSELESGGHDALLRGAFAMLREPGVTFVVVLRVASADAVVAAARGAVANHEVRARALQ